ncbi:EutP/PduV family microcompartment system protein [Streptococcus ratti]|nr:EutP/PduV family microcompartment system protein [Streptococcus ratti]
MMLGPIGHGKTALIQGLTKEKLVYNKTQDVIYTDNFIDTPGEFVQHRRFNIALQVTSQDASLLLFVLNATAKEQVYSPNYAQSFNKPVIGVLTHIDMASEEELKRSRKQLELAGVEEIFEVSSVTGDGLAELREYLSEVN